MDFFEVTREGNHKSSDRRFQTGGMVSWAAEQSEETRKRGQGEETTSLCTRNYLELGREKNGF